MSSESSSEHSGSQSSYYHATPLTHDPKLSRFTPRHNVEHHTGQNSLTATTSFASALNSYPAREQQTQLDWELRAEPAQATFMQQLQLHVQNMLTDQVTPIRLAGHLSVLAVAATILILSQVQIPRWDIALQDQQAASAGEATTRIVTANAAALNSNEALQRAAVPFTVIPDRGRATIETYTVQSGDTVLGIAEKYGLQPETIQWSNPGIESNPDLLRIGDKLVIPPVNGLVHTVAPGDTLSSLASKYKVDVASIVGYEANGLADAAAPISVGTEILVPGGTKPFTPKQVVAYTGPIPSSAVKGTGSFSWPASGSITQRYWGGHPAIDVGSWTGAAVKVADNGYVVSAGGGWNAGYGNHIIVDHGNGFVTLYAHLNSILVRPGENVSRGQQLGTVGNTGNSTGPHLHFEIRYQGVPQNPLGYLP